MLKSKNEYDERQLQVRGDIFKHGFLATMCFLLMNGVLNSNGFVWAGALEQNILIIMLASTIISVESILRGAYFGRTHKPWHVVIAFGGLIFSQLFFLFSHLKDGETFTENNMLTRLGFTTGILIFVGIIAVTGVIKLIYNKKQEKENS
ncbi:MAG: hypothetical protein FWH08_03435 [Oscillospiraceae bacterium]|nr:hypothetical protein [Oscillospiraceae bacterium]